MSFLAMMTHVRVARVRATACGLMVAPGRHGRPRSFDCCGSAGTRQSESQPVTLGGRLRVRPLALDRRWGRYRRGRGRREPLTKTLDRFDRRTERAADANRFE